MISKVSASGSSGWLLPELADCACDQVSIETAQSNLTVHAESPNLAEIGKLFDQSVAGIGKLDAVVTGNKRDLRAKGTFDGDGFSYLDAAGRQVTACRLAAPLRDREKP